MKNSHFIAIEALQSFCARCRKRGLHTYKNYRRFARCWRKEREINNFFIDETHQYASINDKKRKEYMIAPAMSRIKSV